MSKSLDIIYVPLSIAIYSNEKIFLKILKNMRSFGILVLCK